MKYFLTHNNLDFFRYGILQQGQVLTTGQNYTEYFDTEQELITRLSFFGIEYTNIYEQEDDNFENFLDNTI